MHTLIVDDSSLMRRMVERVLRQVGISEGEIFQAANGEEALQILRTHEGTEPPFCLIVSDINMPVMDGLEFLERKQAEKLAEGVPVVMITTEGSETFVRRAIAAGASGYICKPFVPDHVQSQIVPLMRKA